MSCAPMDDSLPLGSPLVDPGPNGASGMDTVDTSEMFTWARKDGSGTCTVSSAARWNGPFFGSYELSSHHEIPEYASLRVAWHRAEILIRAWSSRGEGDRGDVHTREVGLPPDSDRPPCRTRC